MCFLLSMLQVVSYSQNSVSGFVMDNQQMPISGARVTLFNLALTFSEEERTDPGGGFLFTNIPNGSFFLGVAGRGKEYKELSIITPLNPLIYFVG